MSRTRVRTRSTSTSVSGLGMKTPGRTVEHDAPEPGIAEEVLHRRPRAPQAQRPAEGLGLGGIEHLVPRR